jgi:hypothetical protein
MLAGMLIASIFSGVLASGAAVVLGLPLWVVLLAYPLAGTLGLMVIGGIVGWARTSARAAHGFGSMELQPIPVQQRR